MNKIYLRKKPSLRKDKFEQDFGEGILTDAGYDALKGGFQKSLELSLYKSLNYAANTDFIEKRGQIYF